MRPDRWLGSRPGSRERYEVTTLAGCRACRERIIKIGMDSGHVGDLCSHGGPLLDAGHRLYEVEAGGDGGQGVGSHPCVLGGPAVQKQHQE